MNRIIRNITSRLSLRRPQNESLEILAKVIENIELSKTPNLKNDLEVIKNLYPLFQEFECDFPSICFALATGVGKTRLMGAFISYLYLTGKSRNFFVLAPNLTIYEKLKEDFSPQSPKYVFRGIMEFTSKPPVIVTGEDYITGKGVRYEDSYAAGFHADIFADNVTPFINIFNISKINAVENKPGASKTNIPKIKRIQECIGESYFKHLSSLTDLVLIMDEAHRYRATASANAINELKPILGIELTATPKTIGSKSTNFKNTIYAYSLSEAIEEGFVKTPAVATRKDFIPSNYNQEQLELIKLEDGIHHHEYVKVELDIYSRQYDKKYVKPFMLVVAQNTEHAKQIRALIESESFFGGRYRGKVAEIHSKQSGAEEDENINKLISIENSKESTEIVIHVNKLKEGWDVTNLYTIVPLRASASEILTEQTIGRGLRLPYGHRTGVEAVDQLTIIAHDRFQEIIDRANDPNSIIRKRIEIGDDGDIPFEKPQAITVPSLASMTMMGTTISGYDNDRSLHPIDVIIKSPQHQRVAEVTFEVAQRYERLNSSAELSKPEIQTQIIKEVNEIIHLTPDTFNLEPETSDNVVKEVVEKVTKNISELTIDIPNIVLIPSRSVTYGFNEFNLEGLDNINFQPVSHEILIKQLHSNKSTLLNMDGEYEKEDRLENYIIRGLIDHNLIDYDEHRDLLFKLAEQLVSRIRSYLINDSDVENVLIHYQTKITEFIIAQLMKHYWETPTDYQVNRSRGFTILKPFTCTLQQGEKPRNFLSIPENKSDVRKIVFNGFKKCCYPLQKFDSVDGELRFAHVLESDSEVIRWMKPAPGFFQIDYRNGESYEPDFVVETLDAKYICEPKMVSEMNNDIVLLKSKAAAEWCQHATDQAKENNGKPWHYVLIPHNAIASNRSFKGLVSEYIIRP